MISSPKPSRKLLAIAGALSVVAGSFATVPATFAANVSASVPGGNSQTSTEECRHIAVSATQYQGLPGQYQLAYSAATSSLYTSFSSGRPPILTGGVGTWNVASTPSLSTVYQFPTADFIGRGATAPTGKQIESPYGIAYDEATGYVWVTQTRVNKVSVFDPATNKIIWSSAEGDVNHPREVRIDPSSGKVFVSGSGGISVFDTTSHTLVKKIEFTDAKGESDIAMNMHVDSADGKLYVPSLSAGTVKVIDTKSYEVEKTIQLHKENAEAALNASDVTVDKSLKEIYVSSQGDRKGTNSGITAYDLETGAYKKTIPFGTQALALASDEARDLLYVTDYGTGNVGVIDARTGTVVSQVSTGATSGANDVLVTADGSAYAVARSIEGTSAIETDYTIDKTTGEYRTSSTEPKGKDNADSPIVPGVMVKINTTVETTAKPTAQTSSEELVKTYADGAKLYAVKDWTTGETLKLRGEGFKTQDGSKGSVLAVKLNKGRISAKEEPKFNGVDGNSAGVWAYIQADENGNFTAELPYPTTENSNLTENLKNGDKVSVFLLSGSMVEGDTARGGEALSATVAEKKADTTETCAPAETTQVAAAPSGVTTTYPVGTKLSLPDSNEPTPAPSESAKPEPTTPAPSESAKPEPSTPAPSESAESNEIVHEYKDGAKVYFPKTWDGQKLTFRGEGFKTRDGKGSIIAVKLNKGAISAKEEPKLEGVEGNSAGIWAYIKADENGNFTATIDRPTVANSNLSEELKTGDSVAIYLLSGSLAENDNARGGVAVEYTFSTENKVPAPEASEPKASESANAPVTNPSDAPSAPADAKEQAKEQPANDQSKAPADSLKSEAQKKDSTAPKTSGSLSQNVTSSSNGSTSSNPSKSSLANTGASGVVVAAGVGVLALIVGATVLVARRRKA
ncbi:MULTISPECIES: LPXTG cell wall anchor domain-containing protein [unclassified Rothia (in: high G+C Gram-positive bacteria)]|uniref:LPXTG cell wall anchor domain-containing protein n=1 Tax=unclassified Rothia (in: high G+C Gram-positive bacteria) TaxID=2689056 RepID=UPI0024476AD6|nr:MULTISPECIES: LPXTG cell wall anchor domain-containing protein [unclassified Rothia (in: high G+C Gram-positive bacteria)]